jgi:hypothetical protein
LFVTLPAVLYWYVLSRAEEVLQQSCQCDAAMPQRWREMLQVAAATAQQL